MLEPHHASESPNSTLSHSGDQPVSPLLDGGPANSEGVTIIITAYNYGHFISEAIHSALSQSHPQIEVVVVDDGSTDNTPEIAASFGSQIVYIRQENQGLPRARNAGLRSASHNWVVYLDADDLLCPGMVKESLRIALSQPDQPSVVFGDSIPIDVEGAVHGDSGSDSNLIITPIGVRIPLLRNNLAPTALVKKRVLLELGGFSPEAGGADDRDMWIRIAARFRIIRVNRLFYLYRHHAESMSHNPDKQRVATEAVLAKARANPEVQVPWYIWKESAALMHMQSAYNYATSSRRLSALRFALLSVMTWPWLSNQSRPLPTRFGRLLFIIRQAQHVFLPFTIRLRK